MYPLQIIFYDAQRVIYHTSPLAGYVYNIYGNVKLHAVQGVHAVVIELMNQITRGRD